MVQRPPPEAVSVPMVERRAQSWTPSGVSRRDVRLQLLPEFDRQTCSFPASLLQDRDNSRVFGGIERRVHLAPPSWVDVSQLQDFSFLFEQETGQRPHVIAFVNSRSGGQIGLKLMETLLEHIGPPPRSFRGCVCDLSRAEEPGATISLLATMMDDSVRLLVCGGDGTVTWILTELENCPQLDGRTVPVAILPLGTGNDLARSLGWGSRFRRRRDLLQYLQWIAKGTPMMLDQWEVVLRPHAELPETHKLRAVLGSHPRPVTDPKAKEQLLSELEEALPANDTASCKEIYMGLWQNYFEIGAGAKVATFVDLARDNSAFGKCLFRAGLGKLVYARNMVRGIGQQCITNCLKEVQVAPAVGLEMRPLSPTVEEIPVNGLVGRAREVLFANINSFAGGFAGDFLPAGSEPDDGLLEILLWRNAFAAIGTALGCSRPAHLASAAEVAFRLSEGQFMEVDGEPWEMPCACDVLVRCHKKVKMLCAPAEAPFWRGHIQRSFWQSPP